MYDNILSEYQYVEDIYTEYLQNINRYQNAKRNSIFVKYLNINKKASTYNFENKSTFDRYNSGVQYDIYDYTPLFASSQIVNEIENSTDLMGFQFSAPLTVTTYTINTPRLEDLLIFNRPPQKGFEVFRVSRISASLNAMNSNPNTSWFQLTLEYAPIEDLSKLNYLNHYTYSLPLQKNLLKKEFDFEVDETSHLVNMFKLFEKKHISSFYDLYYYTDHNNIKVAPLYENGVIYNLLATKGPYEDHFYGFKRPYGVNRFGHSGFLNISTGKILENYEVDTSALTFYNEILESVWPLNIYEIVHLITMWIWTRDRDKYEIIMKNKPLYYPQLCFDNKTFLEAEYHKELGIVGNIHRSPTVKLKTTNEIRNYSTSKKPI